MLPAEPRPLPRLDAGLDVRAGPGDAIHVNLYATSEAAFTVAGKPLTLAVESGMPWEGSTRIRIAAPMPAAAAIRLRIPGWAREEATPGGLYAFADRAAEPVRLTVNGAAAPAVTDALGYVTIQRRWSTGDTIELSLPMGVRRITADARCAKTSAASPISAVRSSTAPSGPKRITGARSTSSSRPMRD